MNRFANVIQILSIVLTLWIVLQFHAYAGDKTVETANQSPEEQPVTLKVQNEPLGQVLDKIGDETGITFSVDVQWKTHPVSVTLYQTPLHKGLKRILANLNNVIIYESTDKVKIVILGKIEPTKKATRYQPTPVYQQPGPAAVSKPEAEEPDQEPESETEADSKKVGAPAADASDSDEKEESDETQTEDAKEETAESEKPEEDTTE